MWSTYRSTLGSWIKFAGILCSISSWWCCDDTSINCKDVRCLRWFWWVLVVVGGSAMIVGVSFGGDTLSRCCRRLCGEFWLLLLFVRSRCRVVSMEVVVVGVTIVGAPSDECWDDGLPDLLERMSLFGSWSTVSLPSSVILNKDKYVCINKTLRNLFVCVCTFFWSKTTLWLVCACITAGGCFLSFTFTRIASKLKFIISLF